MPTVDDFEDNDMSEYTFVNGGSEISVNSNTVKSGSYAMEYNAWNDIDSEFYSTSGLNYYPQPGDTVEWWMYNGNISTWDSVFRWGWEDDSNYVAARHDWVNDQLSVRYNYNGNYDNNTSIDHNAENYPDQWMRYKWEWDVDNDTLRLYWYTESGTLVDSVSLTHPYISNISGGGVKLRFTDYNNGYTYVDAIQALTPPDAPSGTAATVVADDSVDVTWNDNSSNEDNFRVNINRDGNGWVSPSGGPTMPGANATSANYNPNSDKSYGSQVGADSELRFRVRAENNIGNSAWDYSSWVNTTPVAPHNVSMSRPDGLTFDINFLQQADVNHHTRVEYREDTGSGYGPWSHLQNVGGTSAWGSEEDDVVQSGSTTTKGSSVTLRFRIGGHYQSENQWGQPDARYQFRIRNRARDNGGSGNWLSSGWAYPDYGNKGNVFFEDGFESADLTAWDTVSLGDADSGVRSDGHGDLGISGADEGTYWLRLDAEDYVQKSLGDLSGETGVHVRCAMTVGSLDNGAENWSVWWYDGTAWQELESLFWEYNKQGWVEVHADVPDSYLSADNRLRLRAGSGFTAYGADHAGYDRVVVSDRLHEFAAPSAPVSYNADTPTRGELAGSWTNTQTWQQDAGSEANMVWQHREAGAAGWTESVIAGSATSDSATGLPDGVLHESRAGAEYHQYRRGSPGTRLRSFHGAHGDTTILPAPTSLSADAVNGDNVDLSWLDNAGSQYRVHRRRNDAGRDWAQDSGDLAAGTQAYTTTSLLDGEEYEFDVEAFTADASATPVWVAAASVSTLGSGALLTLPQVVINRGKHENRGKFEVQG